ncbi:MAG: thermonuclease family protein [Nitrospirae bacterium]|nr:thermonuclease family protein [Nitrospirota bacterium]
MRAQPITIIASVILSIIGVTPWELSAHAERLSRSNLDSTLQPRCDLCWNPSSSEHNSNRLPTFKPHRQPRPPDSRPHRFPKGRYKLVPSQKQVRLSALRALSRRNTRLLGTQQIVAIDGDTLRIGPDRIRLRGIDAPELTEPGGQAARQRLEQLLQEGPIRIVPHGQDVYGRTVADVFVDGRNVADVLKSEGFAKAG